MSPEVAVALVAGLSGLATAVGNAVATVIKALHDRDIHQAVADDLTTIGHAVPRVDEHRLVTPHLVNDTATPDKVTDPTAPVD